MHATSVTRVWKCGSVEVWKTVPQRVFHTSTLPYAYLFSLAGLLPVFHKRQQVFFHEPAHHRADADGGLVLVELQAVIFRRQDIAQCVAGQAEKKLRLAGHMP